MGKSLVIKGADFSENCIESVSKWLWGLSDADIPNLTANSNAGFYNFYGPTSNINQEDIHYPIHKVKIYAIGAGTVDIIKVNKTTSAYTVVKSIIVTQGMNIYDLDDPIIIPDDCYVGFTTELSSISSLVSNQGSGVVTVGTAAIKGFSYIDKSNPTNAHTANNYAFGIDFYVMD